MPELREIAAMWAASAGRSLYALSEQLVALFAALGEPTRTDLVIMVYEQERTAGELADGLELSKGTVSHHLRVLVQAGVLNAERRGRERWYSLLPRVRDVLEAAR